MRIFQGGGSLLCCPDTSCMLRLLAALRAARQLPALLSCAPLHRAAAQGHTTTPPKSRVGLTSDSQSPLVHSTRSLCCTCRHHRELVLHHRRRHPGRLHPLHAVGASLCSPWVSEIRGHGASTFARAWRCLGTAQPLPGATALQSWCPQLHLAPHHRRQHLSSGAGPLRCRLPRSECSHIAGAYSQSSRLPRLLKVGELPPQQWPHVSQAPGTEAPMQLTVLPALYCPDGSCTAGGQVHPAGLDADRLAHRVCALHAAPQGLWPPALRPLPSHPLPG